MANSVTALISVFPTHVPMREAGGSVEDAEGFASFVDLAPVAALGVATDKDIALAQLSPFSPETPIAKPRALKPDERSDPKGSDVLLPPFALPQLIAATPSATGVNQAVAPVVTSTRSDPKSPDPAIKYQTSAGQVAFTRKAAAVPPYSFSEKATVTQFEALANASRSAIEPALQAKLQQSDGSAAPPTVEDATVPSATGTNRLASSQPLLPAELPALTPPKPSALPALLKPAEQSRDQTHGKGAEPDLTVVSPTSVTTTNAAATSVREAVFTASVSQANAQLLQTGDSGLATPYSDVPAALKLQAIVQAKPFLAVADAVNPAFPQRAADPALPDASGEIVQPQAALQRIGSGNPDSDNDVWHIAGPNHIYFPDESLSSGSTIAGSPTMAAPESTDQVAFVDPSLALRFMPDQPAQVQAFANARMDVPSSAQTGPVSLANLAPTLAKLAKDDASQITSIQLDPIELGSVSFSMDTGPSGLVVTVTADRPETLELMRRHADQFIADLRQSGFAGASLNFGQSQHAPADQGNRQSRPDQNYAEAGTNMQPAEPSDRPLRTHTGAGLDLRL